MFYRPQLQRPYARADLESLFDDALRVLDRLGLACGDRATIDRVTATPGVRYEGGRLKFAPDVCRANVEIVRQQNAGAAQAEPPFEMMAPWCCLNYADPETGAVRAPTMADAVQAARLMDARGCRNWPIPLVPADVDPRLATLAMEYVALANTRWLGGFMPATDLDEIEFLIAMHQSVGRTYFLVEQVGISPLRLNDHGLAAANHFAGRTDVRTLLVGAMPAAGSTAPLPLRSALVATAAESIALNVVSARLGFVSVGGFGVELFPFDFRYATMTFGSAEEVIYDQASAQLYEFLNGLPRRIGHFHSTARMPDAQAAVERTASVLYQALLGLRRFRGAGQLALDEVFSPQQVIIDDEILAHVARLLRGYDPLAASGDTVEEIAAGLEAGTYLDQPATSALFREFCHFPKIFPHYNVGHWRNEGSPTVLAEAWHLAQQQIAQCAFRLSDDQQRALDRVYQKACQALA